MLLTNEVSFKITCTVPFSVQTRSNNLGKIMSFNFLLFSRISNFFVYYIQSHNSQANKGVIWGVFDSFQINHYLLYMINLNFVLIFFF